MGGCASKPRVLKDDDVSAMSPEPQNMEVFAATDSTVVAEKKLPTDADSATKRRYPSTVLTELSKPYRAPIYLTAQNRKSSELVKEKACEPSTRNTPEVQEPQQPNFKEDQTQHSVLTDPSGKQSQQVSPKTEKFPSEEFKTAMDDENVAQNTLIPNETISGRKLEENDAEMITLMKPDSITEQKNSEEEKPNEENHLENIPKPETPSQKEKDEKSAEITSEPEVLSGVSEKTEQKSIVNNSANLETPQQKTEEEQPSEEPANDHNKSIMEKEIEEKQVEHPLMSEAPSDEKTEHISTVQNIPNPDFPQHDKTEQKPVEENNSDKPEKGIKENVPEGYNEKIRDDTEEENTQIIGSLDVNKAKGWEKEEEEPAKPLENREAADGKPNAQQQQPETITGEKENTAMLLDQLLMKEMEEKWIGG